MLWYDHRKHWNNTYICMYGIVCIYIRSHHGIHSQSIWFPQCDAFSSETEEMYILPTGAAGSWKVGVLYLNRARLELSLQLTSTFAETFWPERGGQIIIAQSTDRILEILH